MNNADMPAMPVSVAVSHLGDNLDSWDIGLPGLTKREQLAAMAMQGLLSNPSIVGPGGTLSATRLRDMANDYADGQLAALEADK